MRSWNSEIDECDGLATNTIQALLGMKIPFVINKDFIKSSSYATEKEKIMKRDLGATTTKQIVWEIEEEEGKKNHSFYQNRPKYGVKIFGGLFSPIFC